MDYRDYQSEIGKYVRAPVEEPDELPEVGAEVEVEDESDNQQNDETNIVSGKPEEPDRIERTRSRPIETATRGREGETAQANSWTRDKLARRTDPINIRWEHLKPFPKGVPSSKLWGTWHRYLETFEIGVGFSNANTQADMCRLLYLAMGEKMQEMVRAAELRPPLDEADCYNRFVNNIGGYLKSMTDPAVEHEAFLSMRQLDGESIVRFHTRLVEKAQQCEYSPAHQTWSVHLQLLKGMRNQELARYARVYNHDTLFVIQAATRNEAYEIGLQSSSSAGPSATLAMEKTSEKRIQSSNSSAGVKRDRNFRSGQDDTTRKRFKPSSSELCKQCGRLAHKIRAMCPAKNRSCNNCMKRGHFAAMCRTKRVNNTDEDQQAMAVEPSKHEHEVLP